MNKEERETETRNEKNHDCELGEWVEKEQRKERSVLPFHFITFFLVLCLFLSFIPFPSLVLCLNWKGKEWMTHAFQWNKERREAKGTVCAVLLCCGWFVSRFLRPLQTNQHTTNTTVHTAAAHIPCLPHSLTVSNPYRRIPLSSNPPTRRYLIPPIGGYWWYLWL